MRPLPSSPQLMPTIAQIAMQLPSITNDYRAYARERSAKNRSFRVFA
jgi:hypothetical protein